MLSQLSNHCAAAKARSIGSVNTHRGYGVGDDHDPSDQRNVVPGHAVWVAAAIPPLVMMSHGCHHVQIRYQCLNESGRENDVLPHERPLAVGEWPRFAQDLVRHPDLPDIMDEAGYPQRALGLG
jgi:hypothetical protein